MVHTAELLQEIRERLLTEPLVRILASVKEYEAVAYEKV
jgi:hypothetical protein